MGYSLKRGEGGGSIRGRCSHRSEFGAQTHWWIEAGQAKNHEIVLRKPHESTSGKLLDSFFFFRNSRPGKPQPVCSEIIQTTISGELLWCLPNE